MTATDRTSIWPPLKAIGRRFLSEHGWLMGGLALALVLAAMLNIFAPYVFSRLVDELAGDSLAIGVLWGFGFYALLRGLGVTFDRSVQFLSIIAAENLNFIAGTRFLEKLLEKPGTFFIEHNPVQIQTARAQGQNALYALMQLAMIVFVPGVVQIMLALGLLGTAISPELVLVVLAYGAFFIGLTYVANRWTRPFLDRAIEANQDNAAFVGNAVNAMETLRYFNGDRWISSLFGSKADLARRSWIDWSHRRIALSSVFGLATAVQLAITFFLVLPRFDAGELSVGDVVLINLVLMQLNQPFEMFGTAVDEIMREISRMQPFARMWAAPADRGLHGRRRAQVREGRLDFEEVGFRYGDRQTVGPVSFTARRGRITFITGPTGSGKTTLFRLALKSLEPTEGRILVDGQDLAGLKRESWYEAVGVVPQDVMLLNDTLAANIVLGRELDVQRLRAAAAQASVLDFIDGLPEGFETQVGERGLKLSGGERQRVSIARALYGKPRVLFLDEASSALDETTEGEIMAELRRLDDEVTILAITHRRSVIGEGDQVVTLEPAVPAEAAET